MKKYIPAGQHVCPAHLPSLPHPITLIGGHVPLGILGVVGQPSSVLSSPYCAPSAVACALLALTCAPPPLIVLPHPLFVLPAIILAPQAALQLLHPLQLSPPCICAPSCPATDATAADAAAALWLFLLLLPLLPHICASSCHWCCSSRTAYSAVTVTIAWMCTPLSLTLWFMCACPALASLLFVTPYCKSVISVLTIIFACLCIWHWLWIAWLWSVRGSKCGNVGVDLKPVSGHTW